MNGQSMTRTVPSCRLEEVRTLVLKTAKTLEKDVRVTGQTSGLHWAIPGFWAK